MNTCMCKVHNVVDTTGSQHASVSIMKLSGGRTRRFPGSLCEVPFSWRTRKGTTAFLATC
jgi:hypothetical protein